MKRLDVELKDGRMEVQPEKREAIKYRLKQQVTREGFEQILNMTIDEELELLAEELVCEEICEAIRARGCTRDCETQFQRGKENRGTEWQSGKN